MDRCPVCQRQYCGHSCDACGGAWKNCEGTRCGGYQPGQQQTQPQQQIDPRYTGPSFVLNEINMVGDYVLSGFGLFDYLGEKFKGGGPFILALVLGGISFSPMLPTWGRVLYAVAGVTVFVWALVRPERPKKK